ncbi:MAG: LysR substrate-binding domain-containing protein [Paracoccus sp. (in: a-proteobacteria)]|nr:LysR substrate-binding domain-containing protein [Paracoccus sp. (in: a-proteobacteria)]
MTRITFNTVPLLGDLVLPALMLAAEEFPRLQTTYRASLERVEITDPNLIVMRAGADKPGAGLVGHWLGRLGVGLVATQGYIARHGRPERPEDLARFSFAAHEWRTILPPWFRWVAQYVDEPHISFATDDEAAMRRAITSGRCAGFLPISSLIWTPELVELYPQQEEWRAPLWLVHAEGASQECRDITAYLGSIIQRSLAE